MYISRSYSLYARRKEPTRHRCSYRCRTTNDASSITVCPREEALNATLIYTFFSSFLLPSLQASAYAWIHSMGGKKAETHGDGFLLVSKRHAWHRTKPSTIHPQKERRDETLRAPPPLLLLRIPPVRLSIAITQQQAPPNPLPLQFALESAVLLRALLQPLPRSASIE